MAAAILISYLADDGSPRFNLQTGFHHGLSVLLQVGRLDSWLSEDLIGGRD